MSLKTANTTNIRTVSHQATTVISTTEEEDNVTTTEDETTQDSDCDVHTTAGTNQTMPSIQEAPVEESEEESGEDSETEIEFTKSTLLEQLGTQPTGLIAPGMYLYLLNGAALSKFVRLTKYHTYGNTISPDIATKLAIDIARTQHVVAPLTAINTQDGDIFVIDDVYQLMALRTLSDGVMDKLTVMLIVYEFSSLTNPMAKALFTRLNIRQQFKIETQTLSDIDQFMAIIQSNPAFKDGIKSSAANKKANFPHVSAMELRKSIQELFMQLQTSGIKSDAKTLANRLIDFNCICKGKPISTLFGLHISGSTHSGDIDDKTREKYKKMVAKDFYLASPYGRCWPQFLLGRSDTEIVAVPKDSSAPVIPVVSQKFSFTLKKQ